MNLINMDFNQFWMFRSLLYLLFSMKINYIHHETNSTNQMKVMLIEKYVYSSVLYNLFFLRSFVTSKFFVPICSFQYLYTKIEV